MKIEDLEDKKILILGLGKEGLDTLNFLTKIFPEKTIGIADKNEVSKWEISNQKSNKKIRWHLGEKYLRAIKDYDVIIKSPGLPIHLPEIERAFSLNKITSQTEIFFQNCKGKIIGITGTKGKSTTSTLIYKILKEANLKCHLVGNIGKPVLNFLLSSKKKEVFVYELSSHQLYNLKKSPHIAVFLNVFPEHLDYYKDFKEYWQAKANITIHQNKNDFLVYNKKNKIVKEIAKKSKAIKIPLENPFLEIKKIGLKKKSLRLIGDHNFLNVAAAIKVGKLLGIPPKKIKKGIQEFKPLPHRLELVGTFKGITFYNDSLSTTPQSAILALKTLGKKVQTIILGGYDRGLDFNDLAKVIKRSKIKNLIFFPSSGKRIFETLLKNGLNKNKFNIFFVKEMKEAVKISYNLTEKNKICLLSPASASFGIFKDYKERGNLFKKYIKNYGQNK